MEISVIIPVYNAENFLERAVHSALEQPQCAEVVLCEDTSPDGSLEICQRLANAEDRVQLHCHPGHKNRGAGATRNLGIKKARYSWLAFLDADDRYLTNRFAAAEEGLARHADAEGFYEAVGTEFQNGKLKDNYFEQGFREITTIKRAAEPEALFRTMFIENQGYYHLNGFVCRKEALDKSGLFDSSFRLSQDTDLMIRMCQVCRLYPGELSQPVAMRNVHENNRSINRERLNQNRFRLFKKAVKWSAQKDLPPENLRYLLERAFWYLDLQHKNAGRIKRKWSEALLLWKTWRWHHPFIRDGFWLSRWRLWRGAG